MFLRGREMVSRTADGERVFMTRDRDETAGHCTTWRTCWLPWLRDWRAAPRRNRCAKRSSAFIRSSTGWKFVAEINGVKFYNDSKATSVDATVKALEAFADDAGKVVLILGGRGKKAPYAPFASFVKERVRKMILIGEDAETIEQELGTYAAFEHANDDARGSSARAFDAAQPGDTVLLAPACASFDMFDSFEHRGRVFKDAVSSLKFQVSSSDEEP